MTWKDTRSGKFPSEGSAIDLPEDRSVWVGSNEATIFIQFVKPAVHGDQAAFGNGIRSQTIADKNVASVFISREAAMALLRLLLDELKDR